MPTAYIALGANSGDRLQYLKRAVALLGSRPGLTITRLSSVYETAPVGYTDQGDFLNACACLKTTVAPTVLLKTMLEIEQKLERVRQIRWGPRTIDLDLLVYDNIIMRTPFLELPHPRLATRGFVLVPLAELNLNLVIPGLEKSVQDLLGALECREAVKLYLKPGWES